MKGKNMKKKTSVQTDVDTGSILRDEYDFSKGVRGKHFRAMASGYTVTIRNSDGTSVVKEVMPTDRTVVLSSDVWEYFPNSDAVNSALRSLISLIPAKRHTSKKNPTDQKGK